MTLLANPNRPRPHSVKCGNERFSRPFEFLNWTQGVYKKMELQWSNVLYLSLVDFAIQRMHLYSKVSYCHGENVTRFNPPTRHTSAPHLRHKKGENKKIKEMT